MTGKGQASEWQNNGAKTQRQSVANAKTKKESNQGRALVKTRKWRQTTEAKRGRCGTNRTRQREQYDARRRTSSRGGRTGMRRRGLEGSAPAGGGRRAKGAGGGVRGTEASERRQTRGRRSEPRRTQGARVASEWRSAARAGNEEDCGGTTRRQRKRCGGGRDEPEGETRRAGHAAAAPSAPDACGDGSGERTRTRAAGGRRGRTGRETSKAVRGANSRRRATETAAADGPGGRQRATAAPTGTGGGAGMKNRAPRHATRGPEPSPGPGRPGPACPRASKTSQPARAARARRK